MGAPEDLLVGAVGVLAENCRRRARLSCEAHIASGVSSGGVRHRCPGTEQLGAGPGQVGLRFERGAGPELTTTKVSHERGGGASG